MYARRKIDTFGRARKLPAQSTGIYSRTISLFAQKYWHIDELRDKIRNSLGLLLCMHAAMNSDELYNSRGGDKHMRKRAYNKKSVLDKILRLRTKHL